MSSGCDSSSDMVIDMGKVLAQRKKERWVGGIQEFYFPWETRDQPLAA